MELPNLRDGPFCQCYVCGVLGTSTITLKRCAGCQLVLYCSKDCQTEGWDFHKPICKKFRVVNGKNVYHTTGSWEKHIAGLREQASQLPESCSIRAKQIFSYPKVCRMCHESRHDHLKVCKCSIFCYCSEKCAKKDKVHKKSCNELSSMMKSLSLDQMKFSYPISFWNFVELIKDDFRCLNHCFNLDSPVMKIHIVTNKIYYDASAWEVLFDYLPTLKSLDLTFILQDVPYDESLNLCYRKVPLMNSYDDERKLVYSVYQKPYHMYFSSSTYSKADFVVTYGISDPKYDAHNKISYRNMTNYSNSVLVLMNSTKELMDKAIDDVKEAQPTVVMLPRQINRYRGFGGLGSNYHHNDYKVDAPNEKKYQAIFHRPSGEKYE